MPLLPRAHARAGIAGADDQHHALLRPRGADVGVNLAAPLCLHPVSRSPAHGQSAGRERFRRYRHVAEPRRTRGAAVTTTEASPRSFARRVFAFARDIWNVLRRPSTVFSLGIL